MTTLFKFIYLSVSETMTNNSLTVLKPDLVGQQNDQRYILVTMEVKENSLIIQL
jgi:hypothetical protein